MVDLISVMEGISASFCERVQEDPRFSAVFGGTPSESEYVDWFLVDTFYDVLGTPGYCAAGGQRLKESGELTPAHRLISETLFEKATEEQTESGQGHELWALHDIAAVKGWELDQAASWVRQHTPSPGSLSYNDFFKFITTANPIGILGLAFTREYMANELATQAAKNLRERSDIPNIAKATVFLGGHGEADADHVKELYPILDAIEDQADKEVVIMAARVSVESYLAKAVTRHK
ncbi:hypothetical protein [Streptomyces sp. NPDC057909]|uniref:hypothetical protein n=1 Tax=Streptomyces sp. NPDC057909 TaxID=3346277 RepID=UPI0036E75E89